MYDVIIIGAGPAGISASLYVKRANLNVLVLYHGKSSLYEANKIENYYGFEHGINGKELYENGIKQAKNLGVEVKEDEVLEINNSGQFFKVKTTQKEIETKTIILSTGNKKIKPSIINLQEFEGKGISYCAICDGFFYKNKSVAIIGNGNFAVNEAKELSHIASNVTILTNGLSKPECNFTVETRKIAKIIGKDTITGVEFADGSILDVDGIFIAIGKASAGDFAKTLGILQDKENINVNENMETNIDGIYACGDATGGFLQVCKSTYEGAKAGLSATQYIRKMKREGKIDNDSK